MMDLIDRISTFLRFYGGSLALIVTWIGIGWYYIRQRLHWSRKQFLGQVNFSLNYLADGKLVMRTLLERPVQDVWLNETGVSMILKASARTTADQPFILLANPSDMDFVYRAVLNVLSERFADVFLAQNLGVPVRTSVYRFAITFERYTIMRTLKLRVMLVREEDLETVFSDEGLMWETGDTPDPVYAARLRTLRAMHRLHREAGGPGVFPLGRVVLGLRE